MNGLSICIPVYNFNCLPAVKTLCNQIENLELSVELLVVDDASTKDFPDLSNFKNSNFTYEKLSINKGRSGVRNHLAKKSKYNYILFLDGDSGIKNSFLKNYLSQIKKNEQTVFYGGTIHSKATNNINGLRYNYSETFEFKDAQERSKIPYQSFRTNNFIVPTAVILSIPFNEKIRQYGHEDTFFAYELKKNKIAITHIENPVIHLDLPNNEDFIKKTKASIRNLMELNKTYPELTEFIKILKFIKRYKLFNLKLLNYFWLTLSNIFEFLSIKTNNAYTFQLFKLFYTTSIYK